MNLVKTWLAQPPNRAAWWQRRAAARAFQIQGSATVSIQIVHEGIRTGFGRFNLRVDFLKMVWVRQMGIVLELSFQQRLNFG